MARKILMTVFIAAAYVYSSSFFCEYSGEHILVKFHQHIKHSERLGLIDSLGCIMESHSEYSDCMRVCLPKDCEPEQMTAEFSKHSQMVEYAEKDYNVRGFFVPNDSFYSYQWHFDGANSGSIQIESAWEIQTGNPETIIAVIDTGIAYEDYDIYAQAPDLADTQFVQGYDFVNDDFHPNDDNGHGTHVAGTIAQSTNNGLGVAGIAYNCSIMPVKSLGAENGGSVLDVADGIIYAAMNGADVINMSLGSPGNSTALKQACEYAYQMGATIVCAAGNEYNDGNPVIYPAAYDDYCIAVGAVRYDEMRANYSNTGSYVDIAAPGGDLAVDQNGDGFADGILQQTFSNFDFTEFQYYFYQGTSMAAPCVAGVAGLLNSNGISNPDKIRLAVESTAKDLGTSGKDPEYGAGLLNASAAVSFSVIADLTGDLEINQEDIFVFADYWLTNSPSADFDMNGIVDYIDFSVISSNWQF
ncbi:Thermophilic serine proteinase precursor [Sedimentisphaera cyanobacteriorum]|uniref:Thermophilic serine proteinase n=1 Tax=Sedimentisphaera cyanobacteriorum TaxID=1940790 RepID=A0A1Q2HMP3_9BACT|nr:S8 family peptidase [Sedimentisphaera cyanobacteriorum]AQQ08698.1 Thermophilic serine proteinase precursor [Sedimentisphaera cyanobacteriorum]